MSELLVPNSIALRNFDSLFARNDFDFSDKDVSIQFHPRYVAMHPVGLSFYAALHDYFLQNGVTNKGYLNRTIKSIPYLQRMGLFRSLGFQDPVQTALHEEAGRFIPLMKVRNELELDTFVKQVDPLLHTTENNSRVIKHVFFELLRNVLEHAQAPYGANVCATYNRKRKKISIGIADAGRGIRRAMRGYKPFTSSREAILALQRILFCRQVAFHHVLSSP